MYLFFYLSFYGNFFVEYGFTCVNISTHGYTEDVALPADQPLKIKTNDFFWTFLPNFWCKTAFK